MSMLEPSRMSALSAYVAFVAALFFTVIMTPVAQAGLIVGLLAVSLPALVAWLYIESTAWMGPEPMCRVVRAVVVTVALTCSLGGFLLTVWSFSRLAVLIVLLQAPVWYLAISAVAYLREEGDPGA
jgi:hypothetical protein